MRAPLIADRTVARHRAWLFLLSFSETACTNGEDGKEFEGVAMDDLEKCSDDHVKTRVGCVKRVASWQGRLHVYIDRWLQDMAQVVGWLSTCPLLQAIHGIEDILASNLRHNLHEYTRDTLSRYTTTALLF